MPPPYPPPRYPLRPPTPGSAIVGRIISFSGIAVALICSVIWFIVGYLSLAAAPLCGDCVKAWLPPVTVGLAGPLLPLGIWVVALIAQWRKPVLVVWSLVGWPVLGGVNIWAIEHFVALFNQ